MSFANLRPQTQASPAAEAYSQSCLALGQLAAQDPELRYLADIPYGKDPLQALDVWTPVAAKGLPILIYFHGGNYTHGYKEWCGFMAPSVTRIGAILVSVDYRLSPHASYAQILDDGFSALALVQAKAAEWGGDPDRIWIAGHSAGAQMVCEMALRHKRRAAAGLKDTAFRGVMPLSGNYHRRLGDLEADPALRPAPEAPDAPLDFAATARHPFFVAWGGAEKPYVHAAGGPFCATLAEAGCLRGQYIAPAQDHFDVHLQSADPEGPWLTALRLWMAET